MNSFLDYLSVAGVAAISLAVLFFITKLVGDKQISQFNMFDYIVGISIGSIAAEMATELEEPIRPLISMVIYGLISLIISVVSRKSIKFRKFLSGRAMILLDNDKIYRKNLKKANLELSDFLMLARLGGYFNLSDIQTAVFESNGNVSFLPRADKKPASPADMNLSVEDEYICPNFILDGVELKQNLKRCGKDDTWLKGEMKKQGYSNVKDILLAFGDSKGNLTIYSNTDKENQTDLFE